MNQPKKEFPLILRCPRLRPQEPGEDPVEDRQGKIPGFSQEALSRATLLLVGAGSLGGEIAEGLVRKGVGILKILDFDTVALSNLNRQFFFEKDIYKSKALALARNLAPHGVMGTKIIAHNLAFENAEEQGIDLNCDVIVSAVDDGQTRIAISRFALQKGIPALFGGASVKADYGNIFVQEPGKACFGCAFPDEVQDGKNPCPGSPAVKDIFKGLAALALYAIDSLLMSRPRNWNLHSFCPSDAHFTKSTSIEERPGCPICGGEKDGSQTEESAVRAH